MNKHGFFVPSKKRTSDVKPSSGQREAPANASERFFGRSRNPFGSFNPVPTKTPASTQKSVPFNRPKSTSLLPSARFNRHPSNQASRSTFLMPSRVQSAPRIAFTTSNLDQECSAEAEEEEEQSNASHSSDAQAQDAYKQASEEREPRRGFLSSSDEREPDFSNGNCTLSHSADLSASRENCEEPSKENSFNAKQPDGMFQTVHVMNVAVILCTNLFFEFYTTESMHGLLHVASMLEKYGATLRNSLAKRVCPFFV